MTAPEGVEDPISALFELSDRAAAMGPVVRRLYRYTAAILVVWIAIMAVVIVVGLGAAGWLAVLAFIGLAAGVIALGLLRQTDRFFREFARRYRWIQLLRDAEPLARVPEGRTPIERLGRHLLQSNPTIASALAAHPEALRYHATVGRGTSPAAFDLLLERPGGAFARRLGLGDPGFAVVARLGSEQPDLEELRRLEADAQRAAPALSGALVRVILLRTGSAPLGESVYEYAVGHPLTLGGTRSGRAVALEVVTERPDGSYDFVPHVVGVP